MLFGEGKGGGLLGMITEEMEGKNKCVGDIEGGQTDRQTNGDIPLTYSWLRSVRVVVTDIGAGGGGCHVDVTTGDKLTDIKTAPERLFGPFQRLLTADLACVFSCEITTVIIV